MPPLASLSADAEAAARQAEFNEKKWVWVPDEREGYLAGWVLREEGEEGEVQMAFNSEVRNVYAYHSGICTLHTQIGRARSDVYLYTLLVK
jgi:myosin heavy chain 9/10/11/14